MRIHKDRDTLSGFRVMVPPSLGYPINHVGEYLATGELVVYPHSHHTWELLLQVEGLTHWTSPHHDIVLRPGELLVCPPGVMHGKNQREDRNFRFYFVGCRMDPEIWKTLRRHLPDDRISVLSEAGELARCFQAVEQEIIFNQARQKQGVVLAWRQLWLEIYRLAASPAGKTSREETWLAQRVRTMVEWNPGQPWSLAATARVMGYSPNHFGELFREQSGTSFHQYLISARLEAARKALEQGEETLTEIAFRYGFSSSQHFSRVFTERMKLTPSRWRARHRRQLLVS